MIFQRLFGRENKANREITSRLYASIVAAARQPHLYSAWSVPDTPLGRYEMMSLHMILFMRRTAQGSQALRDIAQEVTDHFFTEVDHSLRELGIGDVSVPKRIKKLAKMFYGRAAAYGEAIGNRDKPALAAALARNVTPDTQNWPHAAQLAQYVLAASDGLAALPDQTILAGELRFPSAEAEGG